MLAFELSDWAESQWAIGQPADGSLKALNCATASVEEIASTLAQAARRHVTRGDFAQLPADIPAV